MCWAGMSPPWGANRRNDCHLYWSRSSKETEPIEDTGEREEEGERGSEGGKEKERGFKELLT